MGEKITIEDIPRMLKYGYVLHSHIGMTPPQYFHEILPTQDFAITRLNGCAVIPLEEYMELTGQQEDKILQEMLTGSQELDELLAEYARNRGETNE